MPRASDFIADQAVQLEMILPEGCVELVHFQMEMLLQKFDEAAFNAGFDAAVHLILDDAKTGLTHAHADHPQYQADRSAAYRKAREGTSV